MEEFIIVNSTKYFKFKQSWQKIFSRLQSSHQKVFVIVFVMICITLIAYFLQGNDEVINRTAFGDKQVSSNSKNDGKDTKDVKGGTLSYRINNDFSELKNPFSFEHETEATSREQMNSAIDSGNGNIASKSSSDMSMVIEKQGSMTTEMKSSKHTVTEDNHKYKLEAIIQLGQNKTALLDIDGKSFRVHVGDKIAGINVMALSNQEITLRQSDGSMVIKRLRED